MNESIVKVVSAYGAIAIAGILVGLTVWLIKYFVRQQTEDRKTFVDIFKNELHVLHKDSLLNARLNRKSIYMLKTLIEYFNFYLNGNSTKVNFREKVKKK